MTNQELSAMYEEEERLKNIKPPPLPNISKEQAESFVRSFLRTGGSDFESYVYSDKQLFLFQEKKRLENKYLQESFDEKSKTNIQLARIYKKHYDENNALYYDPGLPYPGAGLTLNLGEPPMPDEDFYNSHYDLYKYFNQVVSYAAITPFNKLSPQEKINLSTAYTLFAQLNGLKTGYFQGLPERGWFNIYSKTDYFRFWDSSKSFYIPFKKSVLKDPFTDYVYHFDGFRWYRRGSVALEPHIASMLKIIEKGTSYKLRSSIPVFGEITYPARLKILGDVCLDQILHGHNPNDRIQELYQIALSSYLKALEAGVGTTYYPLGWILKNGPEELRNLKSALVYLRKASTFSTSLACIEIADIYEKGTSDIPRNIDSAVLYFSRAIDQGFVAIGYSSLKRLRPEVVQGHTGAIASNDRNEEIKDIIEKDTSYIRIYHHMGQQFSENLQGYNTSLAIIKWLGDNPVNQPKLYLGDCGDHDKPSRIAVGLGYSGVVFHPYYQAEWKNVNIYQIVHLDSSVKALTSTNFTTSVVNPEFDDRWTEGLPVTFVYIRGEEKPYYFGPKTPFSEIRNFIDSQRQRAK